MIFAFSKFKMPHYIIMLLPLAAIFTAPYLKFILSYNKAVRFFLPLQMVFAVLTFIAIIILNYYFFKPVNLFVQITGPLMLILFALFIIKRFSNRALKLIFVTVILSLAFNFFLNYNFFPNLLKYQAGNELVKQMRKQNMAISDSNIVLIESGAHSFDFYRNYNHKVANTDIFLKGYQTLNDKYFLLNNKIKDALAKEGYDVKPLITHLDYNITTVQLKFLNPATRLKNCDTLMLARIYRQ